MDIDYENFYNNLNYIYTLYPDITKLTMFNFKVLPEKILKTSPLNKLNSLLNKCIKTPNNEEYIIKLNKRIININQWLMFTCDNYQKTVNNENFKKLCVENNTNPMLVKDYFNTQNIVISNTQLKKQNFIYNKLKNNMEII
jgi:hypothetical protein